MLEFVDCDLDDAVAWRISGKVTEEDMHRALEALREKIESVDQVSVYQEIEGFGGVELDAVMEKLRFLREFGISHFGRIAVVTDKQWMHKIIEWEDGLFSGIDMRCFSLDERDRAFNFLAYGDGPVAGGALS
jgi:hypothetical protein